MGSDAGLGALTLGWKIRPREVPTAWVVQERLCPEDDAPREAPPPTVHNTVVSFGSGQFLLTPVGRLEIPKIASPFGASWEQYSAHKHGRAQALQNLLFFLSEGSR
jgi:hypothetical protein